MSQVRLEDPTTLSSSQKLQLVLNARNGHHVEYGGTAKLTGGCLGKFYRDVEWSKIISSDPNLACKGVTETILDGMHQHIPNKRLTTRPSDPSWWTPECTAAVQAKRRYMGSAPQVSLKGERGPVQDALCPVRCMPSQCKGTRTGRCSTTP